MNAMPSLPTIGFDTSAINALEKGRRERSEPLMKALVCGFDIRLPALAAEEIISVPGNKAPLREALLARYQRLLMSGQCMWPPHEIIRRLVLAHFRNPSQFEWRRVDVRARIYEAAVISRDFTEELCSEQLAEQRAVQDGYETMWKNVRPHLDAIREKEEASRWPATFQDTFPIIRADENGLLWGVGRDFYRRVTNVSLSGSQIKEFMEVCPPFRAAIYALCLSWYDRCIRLPGTLPEFVAGRNDMLMSVYLPYCERFVVADWNQEQCLREVALASDVACHILSYREFKSSFTVAA